MTIQRIPFRECPQIVPISERAVHLENNPVKLVAYSDAERAEKRNDGLVDGIEKTRTSPADAGGDSPFPRYSGL